MSVATVRERARKAAESRMTETATVRRLASESGDDATGIISPTYTTVYTGSCRVKQPAASASAVDVGEAAVLLQQPQIHFPMSAPDFRPQDEITITASAGDANLVNRVFRVRAVPAYSDASARRYGVTERTS